MTIGVAACGGSSGPNVGQVKADFNNPSGSAKDTQGIAGAAGAQENLNSTGGAGFTGGGVPGFSLTARDLVHTGFAPLVPHNLLADEIAQLRNFLLGKQTFGLGDTNGTTSSGSVISQCVNSADIQQKYQSQLQGAAADFQSSGHASFDISTSVDLGSCANSGYTGSFDMELKGDISRSGNSANITINVGMNLHTVCESASGACLNGGFAEELALQGTSASAGTNSTGGTSGSGSLNFTLAWDFTASKGTENIHEKGGERLAASGSGTMGQAQYELLFYVKNSAGKEVSYVLQITADSSGNATLTLKCSDGNLSCTRAADGSGQCTGTVDGQAYMGGWDAGAYTAAKAAQDVNKM
jgi:hypothetical protein